MSKLFAAKARREYVRHAYTAHTEDRRAYDREWYADHPEYRERQIKRKIERRRQRVEWLREEKARRGCVVCGERDSAVLDFHHRDSATKTFSLGSHQQLLRSQERLIEEMAKCDVLCANCHRRRHANGV